MKLYSFATLLLIALIAMNFSIQNTNETERTLILIRHAKSAHDNSKLTDFQRPLDKKGEEDADKTGKFLLSKKLTIDLILASPSVRTTQTITRICQGLNYEVKKVVYDSTIYRCTTESMYKAIAKTNPAFKTILVVGHNPTITSLANTLQNDKGFKEVPTCGVVSINFGKISWTNIQKQRGKLWFATDPDKIKADGSSTID